MLVQPYFHNLLLKVELPFLKPFSFSWKSAFLIGSFSYCKNFLFHIRRPSPLMQEHSFPKASSTMYTNSTFKTYLSSQSHIKVWFPSFSKFIFSPNISNAVSCQTYRTFFSWSNLSLVIEPSSSTRNPSLILTQFCCKTTSLPVVECPSPNATWFLTLRTSMVLLRPFSFQDRPLF